MTEITFNTSVRPLRDLVGLSFGCITPLAWIGRPPREGKKAKWGHHYYLCQCGSCGTLFRVCGRNLESGATTSCGCVRSATLSQTLTTHGLSKTPEFRTWQSIKDRCYREGCTAFHRYGGRGIRMCAGWLASPAKFVADMGAKPSRSHSIDRKNNEGHYSCGSCSECTERGWPMNCRWADAKAQARNRQQNVMITIGGVTKCVSDWAHDAGIDPKVIFGRIRDGWSPDAAAVTPLLTPQTRHGKRR
jgi:hypothetical protein